MQLNSVPISVIVTTGQASGHNSKDDSSPTLRQSDFTPLWWGIAFCGLYTLLMGLLGSRLEGIQFLPDEGYHWYYWKLPEKTAMGWWTAWGFYFLHQIANFALIAYAQRKVKHYSNRLHRVNIWALIVNAAFVMLHLLQTHLWYDGLAQDHPPQYPQYAVILLLVWVLLMENDRRGIFFGKRLPIGQQIKSFARQYHGYVFSWAIIYTFWYHPTHPSPSHYTGFFYTLLLMLQGSLFFTRIHTNRYWTFVQEFLVLIHGTMVAYTQGPSIWPMFFFGFAGIFVVTQMHGIGLPKGIRLFILGLYAGGIAWTYHGRGVDRLEEVLRIPIGEYVLVGILALLIGGGLFLYNIVTRKKLAQ